MGTTELGPEKCLPGSNVRTEAWSTSGTWPGRQLGECSRPKKQDSKKGGPTPSHTQGTKVAQGPETYAGRRCWWLTRVEGAARIWILESRIQRQTGVGDKSEVGKPRRKPQRSSKLETWINSSKRESPALMRSRTGWREDIGFLAWVTGHSGCFLCNENQRLGIHQTHPVSSVSGCLQHWKWTRALQPPPVLILLSQAVSWSSSTAATCVWLANSLWRSNFCVSQRHGSGCTTLWL